MCRFCERPDNGNQVQPLVESESTMACIVMPTPISIRRHKEDGLSAEIAIDAAGETLSFPIAFCPVCGRRLAPEPEIQNIPEGEGSWMEQLSKQTIENIALKGNGVKEKFIDIAKEVMRSVPIESEKWDFLPDTDGKMSMAKKADDTKYVIYFYDNCVALVKYRNGYASYCNPQPASAENVIALMNDADDMIISSRIQQE